ncbi:hypothetical protein HPP92_013598 [Vanilla planifolia]|uniref:Uncharacterized protein n=1 Tax=Vanilla planifolia TaxID=51239 RepID=A0A835QZQ1_VANPL|nr:hypothetical protein HPP92_013598 [Vanilla planifolia]
MSPVDETGHGTHVSGIAAGTPVNDANLLGQARGTATGMAPRAHIASYKTCSPSSCKDSNSIKGFDQAIIDGVDLVQISLGKPQGEFHSNGVVIGSYAALSHGILTVNSAGNDGPTKSILDNDVPWILHVGAANIDRSVTAVLKLGNGMEFLGMSAYQPDPSNVANLPLAYPGLKGDQDKLHCKEGSLDDEDLAGKIVICRQGLISGIWKAKIVKKAGGAGMILLNTPSEGFTLPAVPYDIPAVLVSYNDAEKILDYFSIDKNPTGTISFRGTEYEFRPSPTVASLSSRGPSLRNGGILKPDVIAPGVNILSAYNVQVGPDNTTTNRRVYAKKRWFVMNTGTSMAAPHVSGVAALLKKAHPDWSPASIKSAVMTTAKTLDRDGGPITDDASDSRKPADVFAIGAGHIDPSAANDPGLVYNASAEDYIPYLCGLKGYTSKEVKIIVNRPLNCKEKQAAEELNYPAIQVHLGATGAAMKTVKRTVTNVGEATSTYTATVVEPSGVKVEVKPKTLQFKSIGEEQSFVVELSLTAKKPSEKDKVMEGRLKWVSGKREVSSPIAVVT